MKDTGSDDRKWYLAARMLTDELSHDERQEWQEALTDDVFRDQFETVRRYWNELSRLPHDRINKEEGWELVMQKIHNHQPEYGRVRVPVFWRYAAAAVFLLIATALIWVLIPRDSNERLLTTVEAPNGTRTFITLPDSSIVWLNAGSKLSYDQQFGEDNRRISLQGEAFFDVRENDVPFSVDASDFQITVLGTAFNVKAYPDEEIVTATLLRGSLQVIRTTAEGKQEEYYLKPNEKLVLEGADSLRRTQPVILKKLVDASADADWKDGWLTVRGESLDQLSRKIERIYDVKVLFQDEGLRNYRYNGRIQQLSLEQVLNALSLTSPVQFKINERRVVLSENQETKSKYQSPAP